MNKSTKNSRNVSDQYVDRGKMDIEAMPFFIYRLKRKITEEWHDVACEKKT